MGNAMVVFKVFCDPDQIESVEKQLREITAGSFRDLKKEPIGFGIEVIRVGYVIPDKTEGAMSGLEAAVAAVKGINQAEVEMMTLL